MKRRVASLPPIGFDVFQERVLAARIAADESESVATIQLSCTVCQKSYRNRNAYQNHVKSQEHLANSEKHSSAALKGDLNSSEDTKLSLNKSFLPSSLSSENVDDSSEPLSLSNCLFCTFKSKSVEFNADHMYKKHGMFIPDQDHLYDLEVFIGYLFKIVAEFCTCLYCGKTKETAESVQQHMRDKGHCMLNFDDLSEYAPFYDFASNSEEEDVKDFVTGNTRDSTSGEKNLNAVEWKPDRSKNFEFELSLISGKRLGHRSQSHLCRQNLRKYCTSRRITEAKESIETESSDMHDPPSKQSKQSKQIITRTNGGTGMIGVPEQQKRALMAVEKKLLKQEINARNEERWVAEKKSNSQKHFNPR